MTIEDKKVEQKNVKTDSKPKKEQKTIQKKSKPKKSFKDSIKKHKKELIIYLVIFFALIIGSALAIITDAIISPEAPVDGMPVLFFSMSMFLGAWVSLFIIFLLAKKFVWKPVKKSLETRINAEMAAIQRTKDNEKKSEKVLMQAYKEVERSKNKAIEIIENSKKEANVLKKDIINDAKLQSNKILDETKNQISKEKIKFEKDIRNEIISTSLLVAEKVVEKEIDKNKNKELINDLIDELGKK